MCSGQVVQSSYAPSGGPEQSMKGSKLDEEIEAQMVFWSTKGGAQVRCSRNNRASLHSTHLSSRCVDLFLCRRVVRVYEIYYAQCTR